MALTKVTGQVINTSTDVTVGVLTVTSTLAVGGTVSIGGTLTYEDVTNIDSVGLITARNGIVVGSGITLSKDGDGFFTGIVTATTFKGDGSQLSNITSTTINNNADNRLITGSGTANTLEAEANITFDGTNLDLGDSKKIRLGNSNDFQVYHDGTYNVIKGSSNVLFFENSGNINFTKVGLSETYLKMVPDGAVELYYDNSKKLETSSSGVTVTGQLTCTSHINLGDGDEIKLGASEDLLIYHNGSDSYVKNTTGDLYIRDTNGNIFIQPKTDENAIKCVADGATELYHNNTKQCETNSTGLAFPSGKGISFAATADSSGTMANELLDDYEEGTWTPKLAPGTSYASIHNNGVGRYTKIGNMVHCVMGWFDEDCTAFPTNEQIMIYNFPFTIVHTANNADAHYIVPFHMAYNVQFGAQDKHYFYTSHNTTAARGLKTRDGTSWQTWSTADWNQNNLYFDTQLTYMTTS